MGDRRGHPPSARFRGTRPDRHGLGPVGRGLVIGYEILRGQETDEIRTNSLYADTEEKMGVHLGGLFSGDARPDSATALTGAGREVSGESVYGFTRRYGRGPHPGVEDVISHARRVRGRRVRTLRTG